MGMFQGGYAGKLLYVDLTSGSIRVKPLERDFALKYIGGRGFSARILYEELRAGIDPLSPDNIIVFAAGPLSGTPLPSASRLIVAAKSPMTGGIGDASSGGYWAPEMKYAGFDAIIVTGRSPKPVYLWINDGKAELRPGGTSLGEADPRDQRSAEGGDRRRGHPHLRHRPRRGEPGPLRLHRHRRRGRRREDGDGRGDGIEEPQGRRGPRLPGCQDRRPGAVQGGDRRLPEDARRGGLDRNPAPAGHPQPGRPPPETGDLGRAELPAGDHPRLGEDQRRGVPGEVPGQGDGVHGVHGPLPPLFGDPRRIIQPRVHEGSRVRNDQRPGREALHHRPRLHPPGALSSATNTGSTSTGRPRRSAWPWSCTSAGS